MENKNKFLVMLPIEFLKKGEKRFIHTKHLELVYNDSLMQDKKLFLYVKKHAPLLPICVGDSVGIERITNIEDNAVFNIFLPQEYIAVSLTHISNINVEEYFPSPVEILDYVFEMPVESDKNTVEEQEIYIQPFPDLQKEIEDYIESDYFFFNKSKVDEYLQILPESLIRYLDDFEDRNDFREYMTGWRKRKDNEKEELEPGEELNYKIKMIDLIIDVIESEIKKTKTIDVNKNVENIELKTSVKDYSNTKLDDLHKLLDEAITDENPEEANRITEQIAKRSSK